MTQDLQDAKDYFGQLAHPPSEEWTQGVENVLIALIRHLESQAAPTVGGSPTPKLTCRYYPVAGSCPLRNDQCSAPDCMTAATPDPPAPPVAATCEHLFLRASKTAEAHERRAVAWWNEGSCGTCADCGETFVLTWLPTQAPAARDL